MGHCRGGGTQGQTDKIVIPIDEILSELDRANIVDGWSTKEMSDKIGVGPEACRKKIAKLISAGIVECVGKKPDTRIDGNPCKVPAYRYIGGRDE